jgi:hypothetical protein
VHRAFRAKRVPLDHKAPQVPQVQVPLVHQESKDHKDHKAPQVPQVQVAFRAM